MGGINPYEKFLNKGGTDEENLRKNFVNIDDIGQYYFCDKEREANEEQEQAEIDPVKYGALVKLDCPYEFITIMNGRPVTWSATGMLADGPPKGNLLRPN